MAQKLGIARDSIIRALACIMHALLEATGEGHCALPKEVLIEQAAKLLEINAAIVREALERLLATQREALQKALKSRVLVITGGPGQALPERAHLLIVGDVDQLPSVGPGSALADIIRSEVVPAVRLREIFRQEAASRIVTNAHRINAGQMPLLQQGIPRSGRAYGHAALPSAATEPG